MRATYVRYIESLKARRQNDEGFSLIELITVVVILGILVAIAIPVFNGLQRTATQNATSAAAANAATQVASQIATTAATRALPANDPAGKGFTYAWAGTGGVTLATATLDQVCVRATSNQDATITDTAGPGC